MNNKELIFESDLLKGNVNRMMVTNDDEELRKCFISAMCQLVHLYVENNNRFKE